MNQAVQNKTAGVAVMGDPKRILADQFGLPDFRDGQLAVIDRLLAGKNVAAVFPTGGGKSLCYQLPSQMLEGTTVVVSPLIALMKDQCDALAARGIKAARLDSSLTPEEFRSSMQGIRDGSIKLVYVSPERFFNERFLATVGSMHVSLFAIDEAHCISQWGHNFRPDYLKLAELSKELAAERVLALTATATPAVLQDIQDAFHIADEDAIRTKFHRPNLQLVSQVVDSSNHYETLLGRLQQRPRGSTLIYVTLQKTAEEIAGRLTEDGMPAVAYHAGFKPEERTAIQEEFIGSADGIVVATIAFGMGIDKSDIRYVYHYNAPKSLESYAQEIGRAGRDGDDSVCELLLNPNDRTVLENFVYGDTPSRHNVGRFIDLMSGQADSFHISHYKLSFETDIRILVARTLITYLELDGYIKATSPRYDSYKIKPLVTSKSILSHFKGEPREFAANLLGCLTKGRAWFTLNTILTARQLKCDRERVIKAIEYMSEQQWLEIQVSDLVHGYRWLRRPDDNKVLADDLFVRLTRREHTEVSRLDGIFDLVKAESCQAAMLSDHFGESLSEPCGQCSSCTGDGPYVIPAPTSRPLGSSVGRVIENLTQQYPDHFTTARDQARFLCGLSSPAMIRAKLTRNESYGVCSGIPFPEVLAQLSDQSQDG
ncbi:ATP-dependent DNA helicase RecQ [Rubripirellula obstinata]|uniref:ATP-dependent DNA helicase RecQ n=1 Tax=Rubripirellula obstinata TaxID=406547 RepID=A0A5B1CKE8_9BACT|nr:RecQ family ATP-dependent DNA helicase [Rubripirellula obstinata]KAA1261036.1 ATP-dependent DNA helicase RecQ [Rubripirellula obstinata]